MTKNSSLKLEKTCVFSVNELLNIFFERIFKTMERQKLKNTKKQIKVHVFNLFIKLFIFFKILYFFWVVFLKQPKKLTTNYTLIWQPHGLG